MRMRFKIIIALAIVVSITHSIPVHSQDVAPPSPSAVRAPAHAAADYQSFIPAMTFDDLSRTETITGSWRVENGMIVGTTGRQGSALLLLDVANQDVILNAHVSCREGCNLGILVRSESAGEGTRGLLYVMSPEEVWAYELTLDKMGHEFKRERLEEMPMPYPDSLFTFRAKYPGLGNFYTAELGGEQLIEPLHLDGEWNHVEIYMIGSTLRGVLNGAGTGDISTTGSEVSGYGRVGLYVSGAPGTEVRFRDVGVKPFDHKPALPEEVTAPRFEKQLLDAMFTAESVTAADFNLDGYMDVNAGPNIFLGPDFVTRQEIFTPREYPPNTYPDPLHASAGDFTRDGYPDIIHIGDPGRPGFLYVNPGKETRRWDKHMVIGSVDTEIAYAEDIDGDGELEYIYGDGGFLGYAEPGPDPTQPWTFHAVTEKGPWGAMYAHGMGTGDVSGDGRTDMVAPYGWWEQPAGDTDEPWEYHPEVFARWGTYSGGPGGPMAAYDVDGDGLNDVISCLDAHGFGLAWFEQQRDEEGNISFERHMIMDDYANPNNGVSFSELHAMMLADIDGDGLKDIVTGKRWKGHFGENPTDPDAFGDPVIYWFRLVRENGEVRYIPELVNNHSGVGNDFTDVDLNKDGLTDIMTSTRLGTKIFLSRR